MIKWHKTITWFSVAACCFANPVGTLSPKPVTAQNLYPPTTTSYQEPKPIPIYVAPPESNHRGICSAFLEPAITEVINRYQGKWGILVQTLADGQTIYHYNPDLPLIPASNIKILTTAAALQKLNPHTTIRANKSLQEWVTVTNLRSDNFYADTLLSYIGGSTAAKQALSELGVNPQGFYLADGSGLSRQNAATPRALVETLTAMNSAPNREVFLTSLPTAGISGTLRNRLKQTPVQGIVHAKTGTLRGVRALSGYLEHREYGTLVFSILVNQPNQPGSSLVKAIDEIVLRLNMVSPCE
jgi:D-alanyl-D-alanine carboxypeptidase/D-alanyl-D-alanine-endopeptidase (penicillin-binding protein 4)